MKEKGFTLIEITIAVGILVLLFSISMPIFSRMRQNAQEARIQAELKSLHSAITMYLGYTGKFPKNLSDLDGYITIPRIEEKYEINADLV